MQPARIAMLVAAALLLGAGGAPAGRSESPVPAYRYGWPVKPFDEVHPIRGGFDDPRFGARSRAFHFGIDISVPDGTPVYSVSDGVVYFERGRALGVRVGPGRAFDYFHVVPAVRTWQEVREHQLIGRVAPGWGHVHLTEDELGQPVNPLRTGALEPTADHVRPTIGELDAYAGGRPVDPSALPGRVDLVVDVADAADERPPAPWQDAVVTPALVEWRLERGGAAVTAWRVAADFRTFRLPASAFDGVYAPGTRQNEPHRPGRYRFYLARAFDTSGLSGAYVVHVLATDAAGNVAGRRFPIVVRSM